MLYMFEVQIPVDAYPVFGLKRRSFYSRRLVVTISGVRNNVVLRFTTLTAEGHGRTNPLISTTFRTWRMCQVFFCIAHASLRSLIRDLHGKYAEGRHFVPCTQCIGQGFESPYLHQWEPRSHPWFLFICVKGVAGIIVKTKVAEKKISYDWLTKPRQNGKFVKKTK